MKHNESSIFVKSCSVEINNKRLQDLIGEGNCIVNHHPVTDSFVKNNFEMKEKNNNSPKNGFIQISYK